MIEKQTKIFVGGRDSSQPLDVIDGVTRDVLNAGEFIDPFSLEPIESPSEFTFRREQTTLGTVEYTLFDMAGVNFGNITLTKLAGNLTRVFFGLAPGLGELHIPRWGLADGVRDRLWELIDNTAEYAEFMKQAAEKPKGPAQTEKQQETIQAPPPFQHDLEKVRSYSLDGKHTIEQIATKVGVSVSTVNRYRKRLGIKRQAVKQT